MQLTAVAVIFSSGLSMHVHCPKFLREDVLGFWVATVGLAKASLVSMRGVSCDRGCGDGTVVVRVSRIRETEVAAYGAALGPPEARLAPSSYLSGGAHVAGPIVGASARGRLGRSILKSIQHPVKAVPTGWDAAKQILGAGQTKS